MKKTQPLRILLSFCTDLYWLDVAKSLSEQGVAITHLISRPPEVQAEAKKTLPNTVVMNQDTLEYPYLLEQQNKKNPITLSQELLDQLHDCELEFLAITDRLAFFPLTVKQRRHIFHELVKYWSYFLSTNSLDGIFFTDTPHVGFDTVLFYLAKLHKIPVVSIRRPFIRDRMLVVHDYRSHLPKTPKTYLANKNITELKTAVGKELLSDVFEENFWQKKDATYNKVIHRQTTFISDLLLRVLKSSNPVTAYSYITSLFQKSRYGGFNYNNGSTQLMEKLCGWYHRYHNHALRKYYDGLATSFKFPVKNNFVYFPLHLQPERSTTPEGGIFEDQLLALRLLSKTIPKQWRIVVKEHPRQFGKYDFQKHTYRSKNYYDAILAIEKTVFAPMDIPQEKLVERAAVTATITGTGGWESLKARKPAIVFGNAWYSPCQSCFYVQSEQDLTSALKKISTKTTKDVYADVLRFLAYYKKKLIIASNAREFARQSQRPYSQLVSTMATQVRTQLAKVL